MKLKAVEINNWALLGGLRFFLAFIVLTAHLGWYLPKSDPFLKFDKFSPVVAVLGFLLISGFSIAASLNASPKGYYFRRFIRIFPLYIFSISISVLIPLITNKAIQIDWYLIVANIFFL
jgi:peptidoglycan/LPS O-acetylase OafA/YrhL